MHDTHSGDWFYSRNGERLGPATFDELRQMAANGRLNPRLDLAWKNGMNEWIPTGEIKGLFERVAPAKDTEPLAPPAASFRSDPFGHGETSMGRAADWPGTGRGAYFFILFIFPLLLGVGYFFAKDFVAAIVGPIQVQYVPYVLTLLVGLLILAASVSRFTNLGMSRAWILGYLVPLLGIWLGYRAFACPPGYAQMKKMDGIGFLLALIYWFLTIASILVPLGLMSGMFGSFITQEQKAEFFKMMEIPMEEVQKPAPAGARKP
ncbi:MAG: DUF4339 domain-containing protein [Akkermansiaceae bacterium]|nr:DUF4339 domain-containing protein [Akkermansiaceae bacterium]